MVPSNSPTKLYVWVMPSADQPPLSMRKRNPCRPEVLSPPSQVTVMLWSRVIVPSAGVDIDRYGAVVSTVKLTEATAMLLELSSERTYTMCTPSASR